MSNMFEDQASSLRNQNADLIMQPGAHIQPRDSDFLKRSPLIEEEPEKPAAREPGQMSGSALASMIIGKQNLRLPAQRESWKLFSPSTWGFLRNTTWGRKKAAKRRMSQMNALTSKVNALGSAVKQISPRGGLFSNATWDDVGGGGTPYTAATSRPDPQLATNKAYGMAPEDEQAWREFVNPQGEQLMKKPEVRLAEAVMKKPLRNSQGEALMSRKSFTQMVTRADKNPGRGQEDDDLEPGELLGDHPVMDRPGDDEQDNEGDGIPSVWKEMAANPGKWEPKNHLPRQLPSGAKGPGGGPHISETDSIEEEIKDDGNVDNGLGMLGTKYVLEALNAKNNMEEDFESESSDDDNW
jgi:hypothetical protein